MWNLMQVHKCTMTILYQVIKYMKQSTFSIFQPCFVKLTPFWQNQPYMASHRTCDCLRHIAYRNIRGQKYQGPIRLVILGPRFNPHQCSVQCLIFFTDLVNLTNVWYQGKTQMFENQMLSVTNIDKTHTHQWKIPSHTHSDTRTPKE